MIPEIFRGEITQILDSGLTRQPLIFCANAGQSDGENLRGLSRQIFRSSGRTRLRSLRVSLEAAVCQLKSEPQTAQPLRY